MEKWEAAARKFIEQCEFYNEIEAVFLTGSYAVGNADKYSDIDLYIVLNDDVTWRMRGNKRFDGFLIEYFANPMRQIKKYIESSYSNVQILEINMILNGIVILNRNSAAESLREYCLQKDLNNFPVLSDFHVKTGLYLIEDCFSELTRAYDNKSVDFVMQYHMFIQRAFEFYSRYICSPVPHYSHLYTWLINEAYRDNFNLPPYRDASFLELISGTFGNLDIDAMFLQAKKIKEYVFDKANGFDINNFVLKSEC